MKLVSLFLIVFLSEQQHAVAFSPSLPIRLNSRSHEAQNVRTHGHHWHASGVQGKSLVLRSHENKLSKGEVVTSAASLHCVTRPDRRSVLSHAGLLAPLAIVFDFCSNTIEANAEDASLDALGGRFGNGKVRTLGPAGPLGPPSVEGPEWLIGDWDATFTYKGRSLPMGKSFAEFKQLLGGSVRSPGEKDGATTQVRLRWVKGKEGAVEDRPANIMSMYNSFSKEVTVETSKGSRSRRVGWMPILTQRGVYEKANSVEMKGENQFTIIVKEIAPDLSTIGTAPLQGAVVNRKGAVGKGGELFVSSELVRVYRESQGKVKMIETGTGDVETLSLWERKDGVVQGRQRQLVYLVPFPGPAGELYADSEGKAVAVYDWTVTLTPAAASAP